MTTILKRVTLQISHADLARGYLDNRKTGAVRVNLSSHGRTVRWLMLRKNGLIDLKGVGGSKNEPWCQTYRHYAPIDD